MDSRVAHLAKFVRSHLKNPLRKDRLCHETRYSCLQCFRPIKRVWKTSHDVFVKIVWRYKRFDGEDLLMHSLKLAVLVRVITTTVKTLETFD